MRVSERQVGDVVVLDLAGPMAGGRAAAAIEAIVRRHSQQGANLIANLAGVPSVDLAGLSALVEGYSTMRNAGGALRLAGLTRRIHDLLVITRLVTVFDVFESVDDALRDAIPAHAEAPGLSATSLGMIQRFLRRA
jgi:anti-sigma B factor antagonist